MDLMNRVFYNYLDAFVIVFIDVILLYSKSEGEHMDHLKVVLEVFKEHQLFFKYSKCKFWLRSVAFLGHIISSEDIEFDPRKTEVVKNWTRPLTSTDIRSFLDLLRYYMRYVDWFAHVASAFTTLTLKKAKFEWSKACERGFQELKDKLSCAPLLTLLEGNQGFLVYCDDSRVGLGFILMQHGKMIVLPLDNSRCMRRIIHLMILNYRP